jgi:glycosyltransferase involved in cell wall biosynthesis
MRVLHVVPSLDQRFGGPLRVVLDLSARALSKGLESEVLGFGPLRIPDNPFPAERVHALPLDPPAAYCHSRRLRPWLDRHLERFDGVVLHGMWLYPNWAVARACWSTGKPYACVPHGMLDPWSVHAQGPWKQAKKILYWKWREHKIFERARCVLFTTAREREKSSRTFPLAAAQMVLTPYGLEAHGRQPRGPIRLPLVLPPDAKVALFLGRVHPKKNLEFLIEAWNKARLSDDWRLIIVGPGEGAYHEKLQRLIHSFHLESHVHLLGFASGDDKAYWLERADWFLLPSRQENFGVSVFEAISHGCAVAVSDQVDIAEALHEKSEVLPLDLECWVRFLRERLTDGRHRADLIRADREFLAPRFDSTSVSARWASTLVQLFSSRQP